MACDRGSLENYLLNFTGQDPVNAVACPFAADAGAGMGMTVFALFVFSSIGLGLTIRTRHPGPIVVAGMLSIGAIAAQLPSASLQVAAVVLFFAISALGIYVYQRANTTF